MTDAGPKGKRAPQYLLEHPGKRGTLSGAATLAASPR